MTNAMLKRIGAAACATLIAAALASSAEAQTLRNKWCSNVHLRFFVGGAEGDAFGTIVYNGAKQAEADLGPKIDYVFSGWALEKMVQQLREAVAAKPDGIAMMGHPGDAAPRSTV
jgi:simple sugar transport system substrate-binding protein